jgi:hypothetical protein
MKNLKTLSLLLTLILATSAFTACKQDEKPVSNSETTTTVSTTSTTKTTTATSTTTAISTTATTIILPDSTATTANVTLTGGSGKAKITSPANIKKVDGKDIATLVWSSKNYDYMIIDGEKYLPTTTDPGSTFEMPVKLGEEMTIVACTSAMGTPKEIEYTLKVE